MRITNRQLELESTPSKNFTQKIYRGPISEDTTFDYLGHGSIHTTTVYLLQPPPQPPNPTTSNHHHNDRCPWIVAAIEDTIKLQLRHPLTLKPFPATLPKTNFIYSTLAVSYHASSLFDKLVITEDQALFALYNGGVLRARPSTGTESSDWVTLNHGDGGDAGANAEAEDKFDDVVVFKGKVYALGRDGRLYLINNYIKSQQISMGKMVIKREVGSGFKWRKRVVVDGEKRMYMVVRTAEKGLEVYKQITRGKAVYWDNVQAFDGNKMLFMSRDYCFFMRATVIDLKKYKNCIVFSQWAFPRYGYNGWGFSSFNWSWVNAEKEVAVFRLKDQTFSAGSKLKWSAPYWTKQQSSGLNVASLRAYAARCRISGVQVEQVSQVDQSQSSSDSDIETVRDPDEDVGLDSDSQYEEGEVQSDSKDSDSKDDEQDETGSQSDSQDKDQEGVESDSGSQDQDQEGVESDSGSQDQDQEGVESYSGSQDQEEEKMQCDLSSQEKEDEQMHLNPNTDGGASLLEDTKVSERKHSRTPKKFTLKTDDSVFTCRRDYIYPTTVNLLRPPRSSSSDCPCIIASETIDDDDATVIFRHPLTSKPPFWNLPRNFDISELRPSTLAVSYHFEESCPVDKLLVVPTLPSSHLGDYINVSSYTVLALYGGGELQGCPPAASRSSYTAMSVASNSNSAWVKLSSGEKFDDIIIFQDKIYAVDRQGFTKLINNYKTTRKISIGKCLTSVPITSCSGRFGWRKRLVVDGASLYVVVRTAEKSFQVFMLEWRQSRPAKVVYWKKVTGFDDNKVLFMARDYYFFQRALKKFPGRKYKNCIVFSEAAFPQYGKDCWEFSDSARQLGEDNIAVFRLDDKTFAREGKNPRFPKIDWSPPPWVFLAAKSQSNSSSQSERDSDEGKGLDSDSQEEGEVQSDSKGTDSKDDKQEEMGSDFDSQDKDQEVVESDSGSQDQDQEGVESDSSCQDQEEEKMQCDSNSQEKEDEQTRLNANTDGGASLQEDTKISGKQQSQRLSSKKFTLKTDASAFTRRRTYVYPTTINLLQPPHLLSSDSPCIIAAETVTNKAGKADKDATVIFHHPLTSNPPFWNLPRDFDISKLHPSTLAVSYQFHISYPVDKLLVVPTPPSCQLGELIDIRNYTLLALYGGGELQGCPRYSKVTWGTDISEMSQATTLAWVKLSSDKKFDDVISFQDKIYAIDRQGFTKLINDCTSTRKISIGKYLTSGPITSGSGRFGWRKRLVVDGATLYVVVRTAEKSFQIFRLAKEVYWNEVTGFDGNKVLFVARDYYFFRQASETFPGRKYENCIVFSEAAFPQYGKDCWEFTESTRKLCEDDIAVFRLDDATFAREGENPCFPKVDWSPPAWVFLASTQSEREQEEMESDLGSQDQDPDPEVVEIVDSDSGSQDQDPDPEVVEIVDSDSGSQDQHPEVVEIVESDSGSQGEEEEKMECDMNIQEKEDEEMPLNANADGGASLQMDVSPSLLGPKSGTTDTQTPLSAAEDEITRNLLSLNGASSAIEEETSTKNITTESVLRACTSSTTKSQTSENATTKFEGFDIKSDLVPTLQKIWQKHGNIVEKSIIRNSDIIARALESLATMVRLLEDNTAHSLSDSQADYLASTLSDLRCICFKVYWLIPCVQKAIKLHKSKSSVESLNNLSQLSSQVKERKAILLEELDKLGTEENKLKEEMEKVSQLIPFCGQLKLDKPLGAGLA